MKRFDKMRGHFPAPPRPPFRTLSHLSTHLP